MDNLGPERYGKMLNKKVEDNQNRRDNNSAGKKNNIKLKDKLR